MSGCIKVRRLRTISFGLLFLLLGCSAFGSEEIEPTLFREHFERQRQCAGFIKQIFEPVADRLAEQSSIDELKHYLFGLQETTRFGKLIADIRRGVSLFQSLNSKNEEDQLLVANAIFLALRDVEGFNNSNCQVDAREVLMDELYSSVGGKDSKIAGQLKRMGVSGRREQQWVLVVEVFSGK